MYVILSIPYIVFLARVLAKALKMLFCFFLHFNQIFHFSTFKKKLVSIFFWLKIVFLGLAVLVLVKGV